MLTLNKSRGLIPIALISILAIWVLGIWAQKSLIPSQPYAYKFAQLLPQRAKTRTQAYQDEIAFYQKRIAANPEDGLDWAALAATYLKKARVTGQGAWYLLADQAAQRSLAALPFSNAGAAVSLAEVASARHDFVGALDLIGQILNTEPHNASAISLRSSVYLALGEASKAQADAQQLVENLPNPTSLALRALALEALGQDSLAVQDFEQALKLEEPDDPFGSARSRTLLGRHYAKHGKLELAQGLYQEALRIAPGYPQAVQLLADLESRQGNYRAAQQHYGALLGSHAAIGNQSQGSGTVYDHAAMRGLARIARMQGRPDEAYWQRTEKILRQEVKSGAFGHRRELARLLLERGRTEDRAEALEQAQLELQTRHDWETLSVLAWAQMNNGLLGAAQKTIGRAIKTGVQDAELLYRAGQIEQALGHSKAAQVFFEQSLKSDPTFDAKVRQLLGI